MSGRAESNECYLEFTAIGAQVKVCAIDPHTGLEVSIVAPATAPKSHMQSVVVAKLKRQLALQNSRY